MGNKENSGNDGHKDCQVKQNVSTPPKSVYCKNCKWLDDYNTCYVGGWSPYFTDKISNHLGKFDYIWKNRQELINDLKNIGYDVNEQIKNEYIDSFLNAMYRCPLNINNDCKYYKKVWWKFWI